MKSIAYPCRFVIGSLSLVAGLLGMTGCSSQEAPVDRSAMLQSNDRVSSVPWNKPQGWENNSQLGALANDPRIGGQQ